MLRWQGVEFGKYHLLSHQIKLLIHFIYALKLIQGRFQITTETSALTKFPILGLILNI